MSNLEVEAMEIVQRKIKPRKNLDRDRVFRRLLATQAKDYLGKHIKQGLDSYLDLAIGRNKRKLDPATARHFVERFVPPAPKTLNINEGKTIEDVLREVQADQVAEEAEIVEPSNGGV